MEFVGFERRASGHAGAARPAILGAHICFKLLCFLSIWASARQDFASGWGFKGKVGGEDDVVGKVQNDELSKMLKCFNSLSEIEYLRVLGCLGKARMSPFIGIYKV